MIPKRIINASKKDSKAKNIHMKAFCEFCFPAKDFPSVPTDVPESITSKTKTIGFTCKVQIHLRYNITGQLRHFNYQGNVRSLNKEKGTI